MSEEISASITSPEQGAQQECNSNFLPSFGKLNRSRLNSLLSMITLLNILQFYIKLRDFTKLVGHIVAGSSIYPFICYFCNISIRFMSKNSLLYILGLLVLIVGFYACERDDSEPSLEMRQFTRLYVSFEEYGTSNNRADTNIRIIYPADSSVFGFNGRHVAPIRGGGPISYERDLNAMFHASINPPGSNDTAISVLSLGSSGSLTNAGVMKSRFYSNVKGMAYHRALNVLYVVNGTGPDPGVYVVETPRYGNNEKQPAKKLRNSC